MKTIKSKNNTHQQILDRIESSIWENAGRISTTKPLAEQAEQIDYLDKTCYVYAWLKRFQEDEEGIVTDPSNR